MLRPRDAEDAIRNLNSARTHPSCQRDDHATATVAAAPSATTICTPMQEASCANSEGWRSVDPAHPAPSFGQAGDDGSKDNDGGEKRSGGGNVASSLFAAFRGWGKEGWRTRGRHAQEFSGTHVSGAVNALTTTNEAGRAGFLEIVKAAEVWNLCGIVRRSKMAQRAAPHELPPPPHHTYRSRVRALDDDPYSSCSLL